MENEMWYLEENMKQQKQYRRSLYQIQVKPEIKYGVSYFINKSVPGSTTMIRRTVSLLPLLKNYPVYSFCTQMPSRGFELLRKSQKLTQDLHLQMERTKQLKKEVKEQQTLLTSRNKQIHDLRVQLTNDIKKGDEIWAKAKKVKQANIKESIRNFARGLIELSDNLNEIGKYEKDEHNIELREGFQLTHRLFFSTLEKFNIKNYQPEVGDKFEKDRMHIVEQIESEDPKKKKTVAEVVEKGWSAEGQVIKLAKVKIYK